MGWKNNGIREVPTNWLTHSLYCFLVQKPVTRAASRYSYEENCTRRYRWIGYKDMCRGIDLLVGKSNSRLYGLRDIVANTDTIVDTP